MTDGVKFLIGTAIILIGWIGVTCLLFLLDNKKEQKELNEAMKKIENVRHKYKFTIKYICNSTLKEGKAVVYANSLRKAEAKIKECDKGYIRLTETIFEEVILYK